ncbi:MAG: hypothetical protein MK105_02425 [Crocinitomicaceae bacterium]|nr:hypothetical protein [Crocinitomicaceae bacterium]
MIFATMEFNQLRQFFTEKRFNKIGLNDVVTSTSIVGHSDIGQVGKFTIYKFENFEISVYKKKVVQISFIDSQFDFFSFVRETDLQLKKVNEDYSLLNDVKVYFEKDKFIKAIIS